MLARARSAFLSAASVTVKVESTIAGDDAPPFDSWTETVTASGKTTDPSFSGTFAGTDPITCSSLATCADYYLNDEGSQLDVRTVAAPYGGLAFSLYARGSAGMAFPGWTATIDQKTYAPISVVAGWTCTHCYYLTYYFHLTPR